MNHSSTEFNVEADRGRSARRKTSASSGLFEIQLTLKLERNMHIEAPALVPNKLQFKFGSLHGLPLGGELKMDVTFVDAPYMRRAK